MVTNVQAISRAKARELAHRVTSCVEVTLFWRKIDNVTAFLESLTGDQPRIVHPILPPSVAATPRPQR